MSVDRAIRELIQQEVRAAMAPLAAAMNQLQPLSALLGGVKRGPGRPPKAFSLSAPRALSSGGGTRGRRRTRAENGKNDRACALIGCKRPARSKGYCAAHYQKYRSLERTGRLPGDWKDFAPPHSVKDVILPRGRAGAKALAESRRRR